MSSSPQKPPSWNVSPANTSATSAGNCHSSASQKLVERLQQQVERLQQRGSPVWQDRLEAVLSSGCRMLDEKLPAGGFVRGTLIEWLGGDRSAGRDGRENSVGSGGAAVLALIAAREALGEGGVLVVFDRLRHFYPPAAAAFGVDLERVMVIRAETAIQELWALDQTLRCPAVAAVWAPLNDAQTVARRDPHWFRRLQLAAETGGALGLFIRPAEVQGEPSWSDIQFCVHPQPSRPPPTTPVAQADPRWLLQLEITRCQGGGSGTRLELELDEVQGVVRPGSLSTFPSWPSFFPPSSLPELSENSQDDSDGLTYPLHLASQLAHSKIRRRSTGS